MKTHLKAVAVVAVTAALALTGCTANSSGSTGSATSKSGGTLTLGVIQVPTTFAANGLAWADSAPYAQAVYDGLLRATPDGTIVPWLATKWSWDSTKTVLTMQLRHDIKFTDGTPFNADAAAQNLIRFRDGTAANKSKVADVVDAKATGEYTLQITLKAPDSAFLWWLTENPGLEESPAAFTSPDVATKPVGSGPYVLDTKDTVTGSSYVFTKNPDYFDKKDVHYDKIVMKYFTDSNAILNAIKAGQVNATTTLDNNSVEQIKAAGFTVEPNALNWEGLDLFDRAGKLNPALGKLEVRQAINYAIDRKGMLKAVGAGYGTVSNQIFSTSSPAYSKDLEKQYPYNPKKAKQLLADAGYPNGFTLNLPEGTDSENTMALLTQQLGDVGIKVTTTNVGANLLTEVPTGKYAASVMTLSSQPNPSVMWALDLSSTASWNPFTFDDPKMDAYYNTITTGSTSAADAAAKALGKYVVDQAYFDPWFRPQTTYATDANTTVKVQQGNSYPYLWNFAPKG